MWPKTRESRVGQQWVVLGSAMFLSFTKCRDIMDVFGIRLQSLFHSLFNSLQTYSNVVVLCEVAQRPPEIKTLRIPFLFDALKSRTCKFSVARNNPPPLPLENSDLENGFATLRKGWR